MVINGAEIELKHKWNQQKNDHTTSHNQTSSMNWNENEDLLTKELTHFFVHLFIQFYLFFACLMLLVNDARQRLHNRKHKSPSSKVSNKSLCDCWIITKEHTYRYLCNGTDLNCELILLYIFFWHLSLLIDTSWLPKLQKLFNWLWI